VATHQHASIAHQLGWPFPFWNQGSRGCGWHFSFKDTVGPPWRQGHLNKPDGWTPSGARDTGTNESGWGLEATAPEAVITAPPRGIDTFQAPFLQLRWKTENLGRAQPFVAWRAKAETDFIAERRMYFEPPEGAKVVYSQVPMFRHPQWTGEVAQLRIGLGNAAPGAKVTVQAFFTTFDTRHNINSQNFLRGCAAYFWWTHGLEFLHKNLNRMRTALRHVMTEHQALERRVVCTTWVGHDGRTGVKRAADGKKQILHGHGIGHNYWDLLPFGNPLEHFVFPQLFDKAIGTDRIEMQFVIKVVDEFCKHIAVVVNRVLARASLEGGFPLVEINDGFPEIMPAGANDELDFYLAGIGQGNDSLESLHIFMVNGAVDTAVPFPVINNDLGDFVVQQARRGLAEDLAGQPPKGGIVKAHAGKDPGKGGIRRICFPGQGLHICRAIREDAHFTHAGWVNRRVTQFHDHEFGIGIALEVILEERFRDEQAVAAQAEIQAGLPSKLAHFVETEIAIDAGIAQKKDIGALLSLVHPHKLVFAVTNHFFSRESNQAVTDEHRGQKHGCDQHNLQEGMH